MTAGRVHGEDADDLAGVEVDDTPDRWTDRNSRDPGIMVFDLPASLIEKLPYRVFRMPDDLACGARASWPGAEPSLVLLNGCARC